jgi:predicted amidophosphoribosyltransferase
MSKTETPNRRCLKRVVSPRRLNSKQWDDVADLLSQFAQQCEIAYEEHDRSAKMWLAQNLQNQSLKAQARANGGAMP